MTAIVPHCRGLQIVIAVIAVAAASIPAAGGQPGAGTTALVSNDLLGKVVTGAVVIHDYGSASLVELPSTAAPAIESRLHRLPASDEVSFRGWSSRGRHWRSTGSGDAGLFVLGLVGPVDPGWLRAFADAGIDIIAPAHPHALVVRADGPAVARAALLATSTGYRVLRGILRLPVEARVHRSLHARLDRPADSTTGDLELEISTVRPGVDSGPGTKRRPRLVLRRGDDLRAILEQQPEIVYVEPVLRPQRHNNLAARSGRCAVEELWAVGYRGEGVTILHNDSGVDLTHPGLVGAVGASVGRMQYTDTAHGTHTAGSIVGRGAIESPANSTGCGDLTAPTPMVWGMAQAATLLTNNIFDGGMDRVAKMMAWGIERGAQLSSNSWGLIGPTGPEVGYSAAAVEADAAVRDADPDLPGEQPLTIFFSAGNAGPAVGSVTSPGTAKNVITVGAVQNDRCGEWVPGHEPGPDPEAVLASSGRGPSQGRVKPDLAAPGSDVLSLESGDTYSVQPWDQEWTGTGLALNTGTSQACAIAAGVGAVLHEALWRGRGVRPSPALLKAALIAGARRSTTDGAGWGQVSVDAVDSGWLAGEGILIEQTENPPLSVGEAAELPVVVERSDPLVVVLVWTDAPGEEDADHPLVNDLDLVLTDPRGVVYRGNAFAGRWSKPNPGNARDTDNNVEVVRVEEPAAGTWIAEITAVDIAGGAPQDFALAVRGAARSCSVLPQPPSSVSAVADGSNRVRVDWSEVAGATRYEVARTTVGSTAPHEPTAVVGAGETSWIDDTVSGGIEYSYVVRADLGCWSPPSDAAVAVATGACLSAPVFAGIAAVAAVESTGCALELSWAPAAPSCPTDVVYSVYGGDRPEIPIDDLHRLADGVTGVRWRDLGLAPGARRYYVVRASHVGGGGDDGNTVVASGRPSGPVDRYLDEDGEGGEERWVRALGSAADSGTRPWRLTNDDSWSGDHSWFVEDEDRVKDQVLMTGDVVDLPVGLAPVLEFRHRWRLAGSADGGRLEYSSNGGLDWFDIRSGDGQGIPDDPDRISDGGYTGTIGSPSNPLYLADGWIGDSRGWLRTRVDLAAFAGRRILLRWRFAGDDTAGAGWGWWLDDVTLMVAQPCRACVPAPPPTGLSAVADDAGVTLAWPGAAGVDGWVVFRTAPGRPVLNELVELPGSATTYRDRSVSGGESYRYALASRHGDCVGDRSAPVDVVAGGPCRSAPVFWGVDRVIDRREPGCALDLVWRPATPGCPGAQTVYRVYRSSSSGFEPGPDTLIADGVVGPRYRDLTVIDSEHYRYRVRAVDVAGGREDDNRVERGGWTTGPLEVHFSDGAEDGVGHWKTVVGSSADSGTEQWLVVEEGALSGRRSWFCANEPRVKDQVLELLPAFEITDPTTELAFVHSFDLEPFWDGGRLEFSIDGGVAWHDVLAGDGSAIPADPDRFVRGGYTGFVSVGTGHPFGGEPAWTGFLDGVTETVVDLGAFVGRTVRFRWRLGCDRDQARVGWWIDDVEIRTTTRCVSVSAPQPRAAGDRRP